MLLQEVLEPELPICDPHHHLWDREATAMVRGAKTADELPIGFVNFFGRLSPEFNQRFLFDELLALMTSGHNVVSTVFAQCGRFFSTDCDPAFAPVGETAVVRGIQARFESGLDNSPMYDGNFYDPSTHQMLVSRLQRHRRRAERLHLF